jgi:hypothetical protein
LHCHSISTQLKNISTVHSRSKYQSSPPPPNRQSNPPCTSQPSSKPPLGAASTLAAPPGNTGASNEYVTITDLAITRGAFGAVKNDSLKLSWDDANNLSCSAGNPILGVQAADSTRCGDSDYWFSLVHGSDKDYGIAVFEVQVEYVLPLSIYLDLFRGMSC